jgi:hypothetical protein
VTPFVMRPSFVKSAMLCQMRAYYFHVEKLKLPPGIATEFGTAFHRTVLEKDQRRKIQTGEYAPLGELKEALFSDLEKSSTIVNPDDPEIQNLGGVSKAFGHYSDTGMAMLDKYNENREILAGRDVEVEYSAELGGVTVIGHIDVDISDTRFADLKTRDLSRRGARRRNADDVANDWQYATYAALKSKATDAPGIFVDEVNAYKKDPPEFARLESFRSARQHENVETVISNLSEIFRQGLMIPVDKGSTNGWVCSEKWCGAWKSVCPYGQRGQVSVALSNEGD